MIDTSEHIGTFLSGAIFGAFLAVCIAIGIHEHRARVACEATKCAAGSPVYVADDGRCVCAVTP